MRRREFVTLVGGAALHPVAAWAQQQGRVYKIGLLSQSGASSTPKSRHLWLALSGALRDLGWIEGENIAFEFRSADNKLERLPELVQELVHLNVDVIVAYTTEGALAAKRVTSTTPIVMAGIGDAIADGLVASLARPGGNITGMTAMSEELGGKFPQILKEVVPGFSRVAVLWNPGSLDAVHVFKWTETAARTLGVHVDSLEARSPTELDEAFQVVIRQRPDGLISIVDGLTFSHREQICDFCLRSHLPSMHGLREYAEAGGLMSYGVNLSDARRRSASYVDKILRGAKPAELPVEQVRRFELVINLKTAEALGITVSPPLLARADEVIE